ncbi:sugar ABC transporter permease [Clostridium thermosuccinogenes]|uniref:Sugar ABC transporter permease n=2 Tax=Clostridium thermosuccinogenes TaxID=84032 RepID=A0A2K2F9Y9_9CLOT|nr:sugar ABC transporter permease [Pseudoclostridium thermosuccinogenes]PNT92916.1 sugar ABC transporter permease [Pseudoclostridium thermosuccinogenes]PNT95609.1 sugar ABC transporter permease [Pseudoclostridium thermosuccinogenes]PNT96805.1 sugar ABC transporter permease [Pseudoclostridium thermosuccinogenes]
MTGQVKIHPGKIIVYSLLIIFAIIFFSPFVWMLSTSFKASTKVFLNPPQWIPDPFQPENYIEVFQRMPFLKYLKNTLIVTVIPVLGQLVSAPMVAYSITKIPWKGGKYIFPIIIGTMMIPWQVTQIPLFVTWSKLKLVNTFVPLTLPAFFGAPYYIYLMRQFIKGLPDSIIEAARIDGASEIRILYQIVYPMCKTVLTTVTLLVFIGCWNDLNGPLIYLQDGSKYTLSIGLQNFLTTTKQEWELLMAAATLFTMPLIILFFVAQKQFISGIATTGLK